MTVSFGQIIFLLIAMTASAVGAGDDNLFDVTVECTHTNMILEIHTTQEFNGMVYPISLSQNSSCKSEYNRAGPVFTYEVPLYDCDTMSRTLDGGIEYFNTIIIQSHPLLITSSGKGLNIACRYDSVTTNISSNMDVDDVGVTPLMETATTPGFYMRIFVGDLYSHVLANEVLVGENLTLVIGMEPNDIYSLRITNCLVTSGLGASQLLVDSEGCPVDQELMGSLRYSPNLTFAYVTFRAHKFPFTTVVNYKCDIRFCIRVLNGNGKAAHNCGPTCGAPSGTPVEGGNDMAVDKGNGTAVENETETPVENGTETPIENGTETPIENGNETAVAKGNETTFEERNETTLEKRNETAVELGNETAVELGNETAVELGNETAVELGNETAVELGNETAIELGNETVVELGNETAVENGNETLFEKGNETELNNGRDDLPKIIPLDTKHFLNDSDGNLNISFGIYSSRVVIHRRHRSIKEELKRESLKAPLRQNQTLQLQFGLRVKDPNEEPGTSFDEAFSADQECMPTVNLVVLYFSFIALTLVLLALILYWIIQKNRRRQPQQRRPDSILATFNYAYEPDAMEMRTYPRLFDEVILSPGNASQFSTRLTKRVAH